MALVQLFKGNWEQCLPSKKCFGRTFFSQLVFLSGFHGHNSPKTGFLHEVSGISLRHEVGNLALAGCSELSCCFLPFDMASCEGLGIWLGWLENEITDIAHPAGRSPGGQITTGSLDCWITPFGPGTHVELLSGPECVDRDCDVRNIPHSLFAQQRGFR